MMSDKCTTGIIGIGACNCGYCSEKRLREAFESADKIVDRLLAKPTKDPAPEADKETFYIKDGVKVPVTIKTKESAAKMISTDKLIEVISWTIDGMSECVFEDGQYSNSSLNSVAKDLQIISDRLALYQKELGKAVLKKMERQQSIEKALLLIHSYGKHHKYCDGINQPPTQACCNCGFSDALKELGSIEDS